MGNCRFKENKADSKKFADIVLTEEERKEHVGKMVNMLKPLRFRLGITQKEVAEIVGMTRNNYSAIENGRKELTWKYFLALLFFYSYNPYTREMLKESGVISERLDRWLSISKL